jgi:O-antigen/teichoic acid export membrane protein
LPPPVSLAMTIKSSLYSVLPDFALGYAERIEASPIGYRLARGAFWSLAGAGISRALTLVSSILVARILGNVGFGELGIIQSTVGMFATFAGFGLGLTATKHVAEYRVTDPPRAGRVMALSEVVALGTGAVGALLLVLLGPWLARTTLAAPQLGWLLQLGGALLLIGALTGAQTGALSGFEAFRAIAVINLASGIAAFPLMVGGALLMGLRGAVWGLIASAAVNWLLNQLALQREAGRAGVPVGLTGWTRELPTLWRFSLPATLSAALVGPVLWACASMLVNQPNGYAEMGVFTAASQWRNAILFLPSAVGGIVLPVLANLGAEGRHRTYSRVLLVNLAFTAAVAAGFALLVCVFAGPIMNAYGPGFRAGALVLLYLAIAAVVTATANVIGQAIASQGRMWEGLALNAFWAAVLLVCTRLFVASGAKGLALATLASYCAHFVSVSIFTLVILRPRLRAADA